MDGLTVAWVEEFVGVPGFLDDLLSAVKTGTFRPLPVRERKIPKPGGSGKLRKLGIPVIADRVVQAALKLVLEPIFEADFEPVSYGFRPKRRAQDAIAEIHLYGTQGYRWVLDADIEACFDSIAHSALLDRVRLRVKDKRVLALVKAFLKAGVMDTRAATARIPTPERRRAGYAQLRITRLMNSAGLCAALRRVAAGGGGAGDRTLRITRTNSDHAARHGAGPFVIGGRRHGRCVRAGVWVGRRAGASGL